MIVIFCCLKSLHHWADDLRMKCHGHTKTGIVLLDSAYYDVRFRAFLTDLLYLLYGLNHFSTLQIKHS